MTWKAPSFMAPPDTEPWLHRVLDDLMTHAQGKTGVRWTDRNGRKWRLINIDAVSSTGSTLQNWTVLQVYTTKWQTNLAIGELGGLFVRGAMVDNIANFDALRLEPQDE